MRTNRTRGVVFFQVLLALGMATPDAAFGRSSVLEDDEQLVFFTSDARLSDDGTKWLVPLKGRIYEPEVDSAIHEGVDRAIRRYLGVADGTPEAAVLSRRLRYFIGDNQGGKKLAVNVGAKSFKLAKTDGDGIFNGQIELARRDAVALAPKGVLPITHQAAGRPPRTIRGEAILVPAQGLSVISDIDDTVKVTNVRDHNEMLANTFLRPLRAVPGMSELYRKIAKARPDSRFHFVSGSPWQLYEPLQQLFRENGFPAASFHLKEVVFDGASLANLFQDPIAFKVPAITELFERYPGRKFLLVGDSGEKDPEVYAEIARKFPGRVEGILIRDVTEEAASSPRYAKVFDGTDGKLWRIFKDPREVQGVVDVLASRRAGPNCPDCPATGARLTAPGARPLLDVMEKLSR